MSEHVHFIGIGGSGLSAIATVLLERGELVSGSDRQNSDFLQRLESAGVMIYIGHRPENIRGANLVIRSSAVSEDNVEVAAARAAGIPVLRREDFLSHLTAGKKVIAVSGTHGKTTTTALLAWILSDIDQDPSYVIGGLSINLGVNAHAGRGDYFVIEADEYDRMFLGLKPLISIVTNVEHDHPDCYPTEEDLFHAFQDFVNRLDPNGILIANFDDPGAARLIDFARSVGRHAYSFSVKSPASDYFAARIQPNSLGGHSFDFCIREEVVFPNISLQVPGVHNVGNTIAGLAAVHQLRLPISGAISACENFKGTSRRFDIRGETHQVIVIDDYAHHPSEIRATLAAARVRYPGRRIWAVWQPHTYSRTRTLLNDFCQAFEDADMVVLTEIFAARELPPLDGFSGKDIADGVIKARLDRENSVVYKSSLREVYIFLKAELKPLDVVLILSAGDADQISRWLMDDTQNPGAADDRQ